MKRMFLFFLSVGFFMTESFVCAAEVELMSVPAAEIDDAGNIKGVQSSAEVSKRLWKIEQDGFLHVCVPTRCGSHLFNTDEYQWRSDRLKYNYQATMARFRAFLRELSAKLIPFVLEFEECGSDEAELYAILDCIENGAVKELILRDYGKGFVIDVEKLPKSLEKFSLSANFYIDMADERFKSLMHCLYKTLDNLSTISLYGIGRDWFNKLQGSGGFSFRRGKRRWPREGFY